MIAPAALQIVLGVLTGWLDRQEREAVAYLIEENRLLRRQLGKQRLRFSDDDRRRLAAQAYRVGRATLREIATIATPDTLLRWHRRLIARKWTYGRKPGRRGVWLEIRRLVVCMAEENPTWGYTRIQGALKNVGHRVGRSTIRRILKAAGLPPVLHRPTSWQTFLQAHWGVIAGADFFTVRSIKEECLARVIPLGERHLRRVITEFVSHYHLERNHQGLDNRLIVGMLSTDAVGRVRRRSRLGGLLNYYERAA